MFFPAYHAYSFRLKISDSIFVLIVSDFIIHSSHIAVSYTHLTCLKLSAFLLRDDIQGSSDAASHQSQLSEDGSSVFTDSLHGIYFCYVLTL